MIIQITTMIKFLDMKKRTVFLLFGVVLFVFTSCRPDVLPMYTAPDGIYFNAGVDSISYTFARYPHRAADTLKIPVSVLGKPVAQDREVLVTSVTGPDINAVEGVHYKLLTPYKVPANSVTAFIPVVIYRTGDLDSITATLKLQLKANQNFDLGITAKTTMKIKTAYLQKPPSWGEPTGLPWAGYVTNFGTWTRTKYKVILAALYDPVTDTTITEFPIGNRFVNQFPISYTQYLQIVKNYIRNNYPGNYSTPLGVGATLRDPDLPNNPVIQVGPANY
jgi:hypothetical protein